MGRAKIPEADLERLKGHVGKKIVYILVNKNGPEETRDESLVNVDSEGIRISGKGGEGYVPFDEEGVGGIRSMSVVGSGIAHINSEITPERYKTE